MFPKYRVPWHGIRGRSRCGRCGGALQGDVYGLQVDYGALSFFFSDRRVYVLVSLSFSLLFVVSFVMCTNVFFFFLFPGELLARVPMADRRQRKEDGVSVRLA